MASVHMEISERAAAALDELVEQLDRPRRDILDAALSDYQRKLRLEAMANSMARLRADPHRWAAYQEEVGAVAEMGLAALKERAPHADCFSIL